MTLTDFLLARIAEDENAALAAAHVTRMPQFGDNAGEALLGLAESEGADPAGLAHFSRHTPARVLAECDAKRQIVSAAQGEEPFHNRAADDAWTIAWASALTMLALPYADHPDYRDEWKP